MDAMITPACVKVNGCESYGISRANTLVTRAAAHKHAVCQPILNQIFTDILPRI